MSALFALAVAGFRRWSAHRAAAVAGAVTNSVFGLLRAAITVAAVGAAGGTIAGYSALGVATYTWLTQALIAPINVGVLGELAERVRTGDIAVDLARPVDVQLSWLATDLGRAAFVLAEVSRRADVRDLAVEEPDVEEVVRRLYAAGPR